MTAYLTRMPAGIPGAVHRIHEATIEAQHFDPATTVLYGQFAKVVSGRMQPIGAGDAASAVYGARVRSYPTQGGAANDPLGTATPPVGGVGDIMRRGYMTVLLGGVAAAAKNAPVYLRVAAPAGGKPIGGLEAAADGANTITVPNCVFMGPADPTGNVEIAFNI